jgi:hypothetical protein
MADRDRDPESEDTASPDPSARAPEESMSSAYAPPQRTPGFWRNPSMVAVVAIVVVALLVFVALLVS